MTSHDHTTVPGPGPLPSTRLLAVLLATALCTDPVHAQLGEDSSDAPAATRDDTPAWPGFRGPLGNGVVPDARHPAVWSDEQNIAWRVEIPGGGWSSPVVVGNRVFVTTATGTDAVRPRGFNDGIRAPETRGTGAEPPPDEITFEVLCFALGDGRPLWRRALGTRRAAHGIHPSNTFATESPATDGERLFVTFGELGALVALDLDGEEIWRVGVGRYPMEADFGTGSSLRAGAGLVYLQLDNAASSFVAAYDATTGEQVWRNGRAKGSSWASPVLWSQGTGESRRDELVCLGNGTIHGYDARTGAVRWTITGWTGAFAASAATDAEGVYFGNSGPGVPAYLMSVRAGAEGEHAMTRSEDPPIAAWSSRRGAPGFASLLALDGLLYSLGSTGVLTCLDAATGDRVYTKRLPDARQLVASPWTDGERIFVLDEEGKTFVVKAGREFEVLRVNEIEGLFWGTPAVAGGSLLLRDSDALVCVRG